MTRTFFAAILCCLISGQLLGQITDDFSSGLDNWFLLDTNIELNADGSPVIGADGMPVAKPWGPGVFDTSSGALRMTTTGSPPANDDPANYDVQNSGFMSAVHLGSFADPVGFGNGVFRSNFKIDSEATATSIILRSDIATFSGYVFAAGTGDGNFGIGRFRNGMQDRLELVPGLTYNQGEEWNLEASAIGTELSLKAWQVGTAEPGAPQLTITDDTFSAGLVGLGVGLQAGVAYGDGIMLDVTRDDFHFTPVPEPNSLVMCSGLLTLLIMRRRRRG